MQCPVLKAHYELRPLSQTFGPTLLLIFDVDKTHNRSEPAVTWPGGTYCCSSHKSPMSMCAYMCMCLGGYTLMPSQYAIVLQTSTVIYVKILSLFSSYPWLLLFLAPSWSPLTPSPPITSGSVHFLLILFFCCASPLLSLAIYLPDCRPISIPILSSYTETSFTSLI